MSAHRALQRRAAADKAYQAMEEGPKSDCEKNWQYVMRPTNALLEGSEKCWVGEDGRDKREGNGCLKIVDAFGCKLPIAIVGVVNAVFAAIGSTCCFFAVGPCREKSEARKEQLELEQQAASASVQIRTP